MPRTNPTLSPADPAVILMYALVVIAGGGCDWPSAPNVDEKVFVLRGPDGYHEMGDNNAPWADLTSADGTSLVGASRV